MKGRLTINNVLIDISDDMPVPLSYSIADVKEPQNRKRNYSKNIKLPGTKRNKAFFSSTYSLSLSAIENATVGFDFDPTQQVPATYSEDGENIFIGMCRLQSVTIEDKNYFFNIILMTNMVELFSLLKDIKVSELDWSEYDHTLSITNIENSWATSVVQNGSPVSNFTGVVPDGFGYLYPLCDYGYSGNLRDYKTNNIFPHIYFREIMTKCFALVGQTIVGNFIDSERFKRFVLGFGGGEKQNVNAADVLLRKAEYEATGSYSEEITYSWFDTPFLAIGGNILYQYNYHYTKILKIADNFWSATTLVVDALAQFDETTGEFTIAKQGNYQLLFTGDVDFTSDIGLFSGVSLRVIRNGADLGYISFTNNTGISTLNGSINLSLNVGDVVSLVFKIGVNKIDQSQTLPEGMPTYTIGIANSGAWTFELRSLGGVPIDGDSIYLSNYIPEMKCVDFVNGVILAFNLYVDDADVNGEVKIEPLDDFYLGSNVFDDMTQLLDHSREQKILSSSQIKGKNYIYKFLEDNDYYNQNYRSKFSKGYGDKNFQVQSTFEKGERVFQLPFAQTVPVGVPGTNIVIPTIITYDENTGVVTPFKGKPRAFIYSGLRPSDSWVLRNSALTSTFNTYTSYPCINHLDDLDNPTFDFNFELPIYLQWSNASYVNINMFSEYHEKFLKEITGKDSKIFQAYYKLNKSHIRPQSFRRLAMINGVLFRKNEIVDYNGNGEETTYMELVRIVEGSRRRLIPILVPQDLTNDLISDGGNNSNGADTGVSVVRGEINKAESTAKLTYGG
jgi:hypothetical protein